MGFVHAPRAHWASGAEPTGPARIEVRPSTGSNAPQTPTLDPALQFEQAARQRVLHAPYIPSSGARDVPPIYAVIKLGLTNESS